MRRWCLSRGWSRRARALRDVTRWLYADVSLVHTAFHNTNTMMYEHRPSVTMRRHTASTTVQLNTDYEAESGLGPRVYNRVVWSVGRSVDSGLPTDETGRVNPLTLHHLCCGWLWIIPLRAMSRRDAHTKSFNATRREGRRRRRRG